MQYCNSFIVMQIKHLLLLLLLSRRLQSASQPGSGSNGNCFAFIWAHQRGIAVGDIAVRMREVLARPWVPLVFFHRQLYYRRKGGNATLTKQTAKTRTFRRGALVHECVISTERIKVLHWYLLVCGPVDSFVASFLSFFSFFSKRSMYLIRITHAIKTVRNL